MKKTMLFNSFGESLFCLISELALQDSVNFMQVTLCFFQIKVFGKDVKGTTPAINLMKITVRSSFVPLIIIRQINRIH